MSSVRLRLAPPSFLVLPSFGLLEHRLSALLSAPEDDWYLAIISRFAADLRIGCIDIVKEEFVRPLIGFQDRFEKTSSGK